MERLAVRWLDALTGFNGNGGLLVSGGSSANFHGLACAVTHAETTSGLRPGSRDRLTVYLSREGHVSMEKALLLMGLPPENIRLLEIDERRRMNTDALRRRIDEDKAAGFTAAAVFGDGNNPSIFLGPENNVWPICSKLFQMSSTAFVGTVF